MKRDKEWLKGQLLKLLNGLKSRSRITENEVDIIYTQFEKQIDQLEETEITEEQAWDKIAEYYPENRIALKNGFEYWYYNQDKENDEGKTANNDMNVNDLAYLIGMVQEEGFSVIEKPVIPQRVADFIESYRNHSLHSALESAYEGFEGLQVYDWMGNGKREETFARAWLDGYEVEREQKYYVLDKEDATLLKKSAAGEGVAKSVGTNIYNVKSWKDEEKYQLTEQEIKDYDERFWAFAEEVTHD